MSNLLGRAIETLSSIVNVTAGLAHPLDEARAKELFRALHADGTLLVFGEVEAVALANGWPARHAKSLAVLAERVGGGDRTMAKPPRGRGESTAAGLHQAEVQTDDAV